MYFKQLEIVGFKSFPHKTKVKFEPGITAIVGPNGCGKSNIADAIKWVLGEQSAKSVRGSSMEDVIFNGTDNVEPINMAEVSLTLSNEKRLLPIDYDEVIITRRLFRSGESEYILNKTPVRLKDINSLLMGTGMGTSSYSIIEQGKIDLLLSSKPEDRRHIFEEASGITRYKAKKREALRKLEYTENNLVRINDIINEVKRQINSIERQAKKAERYKNDFETMKTLDVKLAVHELKGMTGNMDVSKEQLSNLRQQELSARTELEEANSLIRKFRENLEVTIQALTDTQKKLSDTSLFVGNGTQKIELNGERMRDLRNLKDNTEKEIASIQEKLKIQEEEIKKIKDHYENMLETKGNKEKALIEKEETINKLSQEIDSHQKEVKAAKNKTVDLLAEQTKTKNELIKLGADLSNRKSRLRRLETERENIAGEKSAVDTSLQNAMTELNLCKEKVEARLASLGTFRERFEQDEKYLSEVQGKISETEKRMNALASKEELIKEMIEKFEGFENGVKLVMEGKKEGRLTGILGIIADLLEPESGYELALEVALGKKAQAILVKDRASLNQAISYLSGKGSAHFIIYDDIKDESPNSSQRARLDAFVKVDQSYTALSRYLLSKFIVAERLEDAYEKLKTENQGVLCITKDGTVAETGYVFGGSVKRDKDTSLIGRRKRLEGIQKEIEVLAQETEKLKEVKNEKKKEVECIKSQIEAEEKILKTEEIELANLTSKKDTIEENAKKIDEEISVVDLEIEEVKELVQEISLRGDEFNKILNEKEETYAIEQEFISSSQEAMQEKTKSKNNLLFEVSDIKSELSFMKNNEENEKRSLEKESKLREDLRGQLEIREKTMEESLERAGFLENESKELEEKVKEKKEEETNLRERLSEITRDKKAILEDLHSKEEASREKEKYVENLRNHINKLDMKQREREIRANNIKDRMKEVYKLDIDTLEVQIEENTNWEDVRNEIEVLKIKLEKLGTVNLVAIEEHKELGERFSFLTQQQEDLLRAKESLHKAITKINKTTKKLFLETFQQIQVEFKNYFRMLFGGGHAELLLLDESDILECGIEIVARPPGKKLQNLLLLSGGEKALTTIALLFAIFRVKPSPFCILDEVDAPLDESNIGRFTKMLQEFLKTSQFIIITHSKRTMQMADVLYGITMQEKGISKIVSVKFAEDKDDKPPKKKEEVLV